MGRRPRYGTTVCANSVFPGVNTSNCDGRLPVTCALKPQLPRRSHRVRLPDRQVKERNSTKAANHGEDRRKVSHLVPRCLACVRLELFHLGELLLKEVICLHFAEYPLLPIHFTR